MCYFRDLAQRSIIKWSDLLKSLKKGMTQKMQQTEKKKILFVQFSNSCFIKKQSKTAILLNP